jgi:hypothetical protein
VIKSIAYALVYLVADLRHIGHGSALENLCTGSAATHKMAHQVRAHTKMCALAL